MQSFKTGFFKRKEHLKNPLEFKRLFKQGQCEKVSGARIFFAENGLSFNRVGFPLPRGYGNAVQRNLSKRLSREVYRFFKSKLKIGYDILLLVYSGNDTFDARTSQFNMLFEKAGLL